MARTAGTVEAEVADFLKALGQNVLEETADTRDHLEAGGAETSASGVTGGKGDGAVFERDDTAVGDGDPADIGGEVFSGGVASWPGLRVDIPGDGPEVGVDVLEQPRLAYSVFEDSAVEGREGLNGDKEVVSGGTPR